MSYADFLADAAAVRDFGEWYLEAYLDDPSDVQEILRFSRHGTPSPASSTSIGSDTIPANTAYRKRILQAPTLRQSIWQQGKIGGRSLPSFGSIVLRNADGGLDGYRTKTGYKWGNRRAKVFFFDRRRLGATAGKTFDGKLGAPKFALDRVEVPLLGHEAQFQQPISSRVYRGSSYLLELTGDRTVSYGTPAAVNLTGSMSGECWLWVDAAPTGDNMVWGWSNASARPWGLAITSTMKVRIRRSIGAVAEAVDTTATIAVRKWYHVAWSISGRDVVIYLWDDDAQTLTTETFINGFSGATGDANGGGGSYVYRSNSDATLRIWLDEARIWSVVRTSDELDEHRFGPIADAAIPAELVHYTRMDDGAGTAVTDSSATAAHGTISGAGSSSWLWAMQGASELAGSYCPELWGRRFGIAPVLVDPYGFFELAGLAGSSGPAYQVAGGGAIEELTAVYEGGNALTIDSDAGNMRTFLTTSPAAGHVLPFLARGLFKLGTAPTLTITCTAKGYNGGSLGYVETAAGIIRDIVTRRGPQLVDPTDLDTSSFTALDTSDDSPIGVLITQAQPIADVLDYVAGSVGAWWGYQRGSTLLHVERFEGPAASADYSFDQRDIVKVEAMDAPAPIYEVRIRYRPNATPLGEDQVAAVLKNTAGSGWQSFTMPYLEEVATDRALLASYPGDASRSITVETGLYLQEDARAFARFLLSVLGGIKEAWRLTMRSTGLQATIGKTAAITFTTQDGRQRLGFDGSGRFACVTVGDDPQSGEFPLEVWG